MSSHSQTFHLVLTEKMQNAQGSKSQTDGAHKSEWNPKKNKLENTQKNYLSYWKISSNYILIILQEK